jgi:hypothetical protein
MKCPWNVLRHEPKVSDRCCCLLLEKCMAMFISPVHVHTAHSSVTRLGKFLPIEIFFLLVIIWKNVKIARFLVHFFNFKNYNIKFDETPVAPQFGRIFLTETSGHPWRRWGHSSWSVTWMAPRRTAIITQQKLAISHFIEKKMRME